ncbi:MAG: Spore coat protein SA [Candidatus Hydrogenedentes bacterium ADurb.Bin101]|nr:MAG: Spore coat protein SA [Candidatus Hydrogenedentes bacterium ADurb.Bin101]
MIVGRGTRQEQLAIRPVRALGLEDRVHFTGYLDGDDYAGALAAMDVGMFLTPGTDGTCRAVREMMSMGKPMITSNRGMLAEIVTHKNDGLVTDGSSGQLQAAMRLFYENADLRRRYGIAARETARTRFSMDRYAGAVLEVYEKTLVHPKQY